MMRRCVLLDICAGCNGTNQEDTLMRPHPRVSVSGAKSCFTPKDEAALLARVAKLEAEVASIPYNIPALVNTAPVQAASFTAQQSHAIDPELSKLAGGAKPETVLDYPLTYSNVNVNEDHDA